MDDARHSYIICIAWSFGVCAMKTQTIEVEGLPEGVSIKRISLSEIPVVFVRNIKLDNVYIEFEKIQPRRIVIEETSNESVSYRSGFYPTQVFSNGLRLHDQPHIWREVKETEIPFTNDEPKLSLSVDDAKELLNYLPSNTDFYKKLVEYIKDK